MHPSFLGLSVGVAALTFCIACGGSPSTPSTPFPCPLAAAPVAFPAPPHLIYPEDGATGVPDGDLPLILSWTYGGSVSLVSNTASPIPDLAPTSVPSPLPSPAATASPILPSAPVAYAVPQLKSATKYSVIAAFSPAPCAPPSANIGSFTTR